jgi:Lar family restriction alleviation protein
MTETELKPCPFCGSNCVYANVGIYIGKRHESVTIKCDDCGASIWGVTEETAIAAWNRRAE